jgi:hypothetical protein
MAKAKGANDAKAPQSWNRYSYVLSDPINGLDPHGLFLQKPETPSDPWCAPPEVLYAGTCTFAINDGSGKGLPNGGGGGGGAGGPVAQAYSVLNTAYNTAIAALKNPQCANLFRATNGSGFLTGAASGQVLNPQTVLASLVSGSGQYGSITFGNLSPDGTVATTQGAGWGLSWQGPYYSSVSITLDTTIWNATATGSTTATYDAETLLHELGHAISDLAAGFGSQNSFLGDSRSDANSAKNSALVAANCFPNP